MEPDQNNSDALLDLEPSPYLRRQKQVEVRRGRFNIRNAARLRKILFAALVVGALGWCGYGAVDFGAHDAQFRLTEHRIEIRGAAGDLKYVSARQVAEKFAGDVGRSVFLTALEKRRAMIEDIPWVEAAMVARALPDRLRVSLRERVPVAFLRTGSGLALVDANGVILPLAASERPSRASFTFPVISGFTEQDPIQLRQPRMRLYRALIEDLDRDGAHHSLDISEVDLADPEDARIVVAARDSGDAVVLHLGNANFRQRYQAYLTHIREWRQQFEKIYSIDLRYERQIVVNPERR